MKSINSTKLGDKRRRKSKKGIEAIEVALTLPLLTIVMFATIQITHHWHVEKLLKLATFEAMKAGASETGTAQDAIDTFETHCAALGINDVELVIDETEFDSAETGDYLYLEGKALAQSNQILMPAQIGLSDWMNGGVICHRKEGL